jgi:D-alanyl-D-alanine dipeptidase
MRRNFFGTPREGQKCFAKFLERQLNGFVTGRCLKRLSRVAVCLALLVFLASCATPSKNNADLVDVQRVIPGIVLDIRYATTNNFTGKQLYPVARCCLRREAAKSLRDVERELRGMGLALKVYDGYRPLSVQKKMWAIVPNEDYVANPAKGSRHNRGAAVDVTLIKPDGAELPMGTPFDDFTEKAHGDYTNLPPDILQNRALLQGVMEKHNFHRLRTEWWHFDFKDWTKYEILDVDNSKIK